MDARPVVVSCFQVAPASVVCQSAASSAHWGTERYLTPRTQPSRLFTKEIDSARKMPGSLGSERWLQLLPPSVERKRPWPPILAQTTSPQAGRRRTGAAL